MGLQNLTSKKGAIALNTANSVKTKPPGCAAKSIAATSTKPPHGATAERSRSGLVSQENVLSVATGTELNGGERRERSILQKPAVAQPAHDPRLEQLLSEECKDCKGWRRRSDSSGTLEHYDGASMTALERLTNSSHLTGDGSSRTHQGTAPCEVCGGTGKIG